MKKRILHVSKYFYPEIGGLEQIAMDVINSLRDDYEQEVVCFSETGKDRKDNVNGIPVVRSKVKKIVASQPLSLSFEKILKEEIDDFQPDILLLHVPNPFAIYLVLKHLSPKCKLVVYWHSDIVKQKQAMWLFDRMHRRILDKADIIVATSPNYLEGSDYLSCYRNKCVIVPNCINEKRLAITDLVNKKAEKLRSKYTGRILCFAVGRLVEYKGFEYLIESAKYLNEDFAIVIGGAGPLGNKLVKQIERDSVDNIVEVVGRLSDDDLKAYLLACDIFCFPSITKNEAFGVALAEGMYFGKPTVTFNISGSGVNYVSVDGKTGIEVENRNSEAYANALMEFGNDEKMREIMGKAAKCRVVENFLYEQFVKNIQSVLERL